MVRISGGDPFINSPGLFTRTYHNSPSRMNAGKPFELTWKEKIYLRRMLKGETMTAIAKHMSINTGTVSATLKNAAHRFGLQTYKELLVNEEVLKQLEEE